MVLGIAQEVLRRQRLHLADGRELESEATFVLFRRGSDYFDHPVWVNHLHVSVLACVVTNALVVVFTLCGTLL